MLQEAHIERLKWIYRTNPCNQYYTIEIDIRDKEAELHLPIRPDYLHGGGVIHGSVYFKMLDDAATFAVSSIVKDFGIVTASFNIYFTRPVSEGTIHAFGRVVHESRRLFIAEAEVFDDNGRVLARGSGSFMRSTVPWPQRG